MNFVKALNVLVVVSVIKHFHRPFAASFSTSVRSSFSKVCDQ